MAYSESEGERYYRTAQVAVVIVALSVVILTGVLLWA